MMMNGPAPATRNERLQRCREIAERLHAIYGDRVLAIGVYGSMARGTDGPFSDIELFCVLENGDEPVDFSHEWSAGPWKAEVNVLCADAILRDAATVEGEWPLSHGPYFSPLSLYDPKNFFATLREAAESPPAEAFRAEINAVLVGEMYEFIGKLRNVNHSGPRSYLPYLAMQFAQYGAMIIGLHNRRVYSTGAMVLPEAVTLPDRPDGYDDVARMVMTGELAQAEQIVSACERFWAGLVGWAAQHGYVIDSERIPF